MPEEEPAPTPVPDRMCAGCHSGVTIEGTSHAVLGKTIPDGACEACHGSAAKHIEDPWQHPLNKDSTSVRRSALCLSCHRSGPAHVTNWVDSDFAKAGKTCADCHSVHEESDRHLTFAANEAGFLGDDSCRVCHAPAFASLGTSFHSGVLGQPGGGCEACHGTGAAHVKAVASGAEDLAIAREPSRKNCLLCHQKAPEIHKSLNEAFDGWALECTVCHDAHVNREDPLWSDTGEVEAKAVGNEVCATCHGAIVKLTEGSVHATVSEEEGCERCHGPASAHVASGGRTRFIVNPSRQSPAKASEGCLECHGEAPDHARDWKGGSLEKSGLSCLTCHNAHGPKEGQGRPITAEGASPGGKAQYVGSQVCSVCHSKPHPDLMKSPHRTLMEDETKAGCESCHGPGSNHVSSGGAKESILNPVGEAQSELCYRCHGLETKLIRWKRSEHAKANLTCTSCHDPLKEAGKGSKKQDPESCYVCHAQIRAQFRMPNRHPIDKGTMNCSSCHDPHADVSGFLALEIRKERCVECHKQYRGPYLYEHEAHRQDGCLACHLPHGSTARRLLTHQKVANLCIQCHVTPASHSLSAGSSFRNCLSCHVNIHGSYVNENFFR
jgi:DmsE family decaheme c-type cytochrome